MHSFWLFALRLIAVRPGSLTQAAESAPIGAATNTQPKSDDCYTPLRP